jgi:hypothetical protein
MLEDLNRNGMGGVVEAVYATTLLQAVSSGFVLLSGSCTWDAQHSSRRP